MAHSLRPRTPNTIVEPDKLEEEFASIRSKGYSVDDEEYTLGVACLAAPIDQHGISLSAPKDRFVANFATYLDALLAITGVSPETR
jgi:DNA-binding IclR family transcriptional regulator